MSNDETSIDPWTFTSTGEEIASILETAAKPGTPPVAVPGVSPVDTAAVGLASTMGLNIGAASSEMAPRGPKMRIGSQTAAAEIQAQDLANAQQIKAVSAADQILGNLVSGAGAEQKPTPGTLLEALAAKGGTSAGAAGVAGDAAKAGSGPWPFLVDAATSSVGDKTDWVLGAGSAGTSKMADGVAGLTRSLNPENKWVVKAVEEVKMFGTSMKGSPIGAIPTLAFSGAAFAKDVGTDGMPPVHAFLREGVSIFAGTAGSVLPGGPVTGIAVGNFTAKVMDTFYEMGKSVAELGGPGEVLKVARWGRAPS